MGVLTMKRGAKLNANGVCPDCGRDYALTDGPSETHCTADDCPSTTRFDFQHITPDGYAVYYVEGGLVQDVCTDAKVEDQPRVIVLDFDVEGSSWNPVPFDKHSTSFRSLCLALDRAPMTVDQAYVADALDACARFEQANPEDES